MIMGAVVAILLLVQEPADDEKKADGLMKKAEALIEAKDFELARGVYEVVAKKYPSTKAAKLASHRAGDNAVLDCRIIVQNGPSENRIDVHVMGDSFRYTNAEQRSFFGISKGVFTQLVGGDCLREYQNYFNGWRVLLASKEQGTSSDTKTFDTALGVRSNGGGYSVDGRKSAEVRTRLACDDGQWLVLVRMGGGVDSGGGGIVTWTGGGTLVHEFGHAFGALGDEYTSEPGPGPQRPIGRGLNYSDTPDLAKVAWAHWFEKPEIARAARLGAFEGANAHEKGQWKPTSGGCTMGSGGGGAFCPVCREQMVLQIYLRVNPIDEASPSAAATKVKLKKAGDAWKVDDADALPWILPLQPFTHKLTVRWRLKKMDAPAIDTPTGGNGEPAPPMPSPEPQTPPAPQPRTRSFARLPFEGQDLKSNPRPDRRGRAVERPLMTDAKIEPGRYVLTVEVRDEMSDEMTDPETKRKVKVPWVLKDPTNALVERMAWEVAFTE